MRSNKPAHHPGASVPEKSKKLIWVHLVEITGIHPMRLGELIEMGWVEPEMTVHNEYIFHEKDVYRIRKLVRLCRDFDLSTTAGTIIIDLLERVEQLQNEVSQLRRLI
ncbi:MAG: chaperone modulator CbpM [Desulfovibrionales bacterium]